MARANRVWETSVTTGTGNLTLAGAVENFRTFSPKIANATPFRYMIDNEAGLWEIGTGQLSSASVLVRTTVEDNSAGDTTKINFTGELQVFIALSAADEAAFDAKLDATAKAADSNLLDGISSESFARTDITETFDGNVTFTNELFARDYGITMPYECSIGEMQGQKLFLNMLGQFSDHYQFATVSRVEHDTGSGLTDVSSAGYEELFAGFPSTTTPAIDSTVNTLRITFQVNNTYPNGGLLQIYQEWQTGGPKPYTVTKLERDIDNTFAASTTVISGWSASNYFAHQTVNDHAPESWYRIEIDISGRTEAIKFVNIRHFTSRLAYGQFGGLPFSWSASDMQPQGTVDGRDIATDGTKLDSIADNANNYSHPANHVIADTTGLQTALDDKVDDGQVLTNVPAGALFTDTDTVYTLDKAKVEAVLTGSVTSHNHTGTYATFAQGALADSAIQDISGKFDKTGGTISGDVTVSGGTGSATLTVVADSDNLNEDDVAQVLLIQDGGIVFGSWGFASDNNMTFEAGYTGSGINFIPGATSTAKVNGSQIRTDAYNNDYTHPANHSPSIITQDASNRFVTDTEKSTWNGKSDAHTHPYATTAQGTLADTALQSFTETSHADVVVDGDVDEAATDSKIVKRTSGGHIYGDQLFGTYMNMSHNPVTANTHDVFFSSSDAYIRKNTKAGFLASLNVADGANNYILDKAKVEAVLTGEITTHTHATSEATSTTATQTSLNFLEGNVCTRTPTGNITFTLDNVPASNSAKMELVITAGGFTVTWPTVTWENGGVAPTLGTLDRVIFSKYDGNAVIYAHHTSMVA